ncbi:MAG: hypothetical protein ACHQT8_00680 [Chlamydiales bacterium]
MATQKEINAHLKAALKEVGKITPWFDKEVGEWVFSHRLYPVEYGGRSEQEVVENYPKYLREFILHRLDSRLEKHVEKKTKGRGGIRTGAGRPKGSKKRPPTKTIRLEARLALWIKKHEDDIYRLISGEKILIPAKKIRRDYRY